MASTQSLPKDIDEYISSCPVEVQPLLQQVRATIRAAAPEAEETISYQMPTFKFHGNLVYFAAFKNHIGFYPIPSGMAEFAEELSTYTTGKGSVQFPLDRPIPFDLITRIVRFRVEENLKKAAAKKNRK
jgi:uncharacterized protein YdhG (YjbR/CyaY superfamily)